MLAPNAQVIRDGKKLTILAKELVPGDLVIVNRGDKIPADLRVVEAKNLQLQEAILTGESLPVAKLVTPVAEEAIVSGRHSMLYSGDASN